MHSCAQEAPIIDKRKAHPNADTDVQINLEAYSSFVKSALRKNSDQLVKFIKEKKEVGLKACNGCEKTSVACIGDNPARCDHCIKYRNTCSYKKEFLVWAVRHKFRISTSYSTQLYNNLGRSLKVPIHVGSPSNEDVDSLPPKQAKITSTANLSPSQSSSKVDQEDEDEDLMKYEEQQDTDKGDENDDDDLVKHEEESSLDEAERKMRKRQRTSARPIRLSIAQEAADLIEENLQAQLKDAKQRYMLLEEQNNRQLERYNLLSKEVVKMATTIEELRYKVGRSSKTKSRTQT